MSTVTLQVDDELMRRAEELAASRNMTVAAMLERLLRVVADSALEDKDLPPRTRAALGILPPLTDVQNEDILDEHRTRKYGG